MYELEFTKSAQKDLKKVKRSGNQALLKKMEKLKEAPKRHGRPLQYNFAGYWRASSPPFRIMYTINEEEKTVQIVKIDTRDEIYEDDL